MGIYGIELRGVASRRIAIVPRLSAFPVAPFSDGETNSWTMAGSWVVPRRRPNESQTANDHIFLWHPSMRPKDFRRRHGSDKRVVGGDDTCDTGSHDKGVTGGVTPVSALEVRSLNHHHEGRVIEDSTRTPAVVVSIRQVSAQKHAQSSIDDEPLPDPIDYATPEDWLKAIVRYKTGHDIPQSDLLWIKECLELRAVSVQQYVAEVRQHVRNPWKNPIGLLKAFAKDFRRRTRPSSPPVTQDQVEAQARKCPCSHGYIDPALRIACKNCNLGRDLALQEARKLRLAKEPKIETKGIFPAGDRVMRG